MKDQKEVGCEVRKRDKGSRPTVTRAEKKMIGTCTTVLMQAGECRNSEGIPIATFYFGNAFAIPKVLHL